MLTMSSDSRTSREDADSDQSNEPNATPLQEGLDYYLENGLMVFTAHFLRKRGYCCERGCRHCPYGYFAPDKV
jgi:Family of unknown function (DUF5522)